MNRVVGIETEYGCLATGEQRRGVATRLLGAIVEELRALGHDTLASTVLTAQEASMLWHWRHGFRLQST